MACVEAVGGEPCHAAGQLLAVEPPEWQLANASVASAEAHFEDPEPSVTAQPDSLSGMTRLLSSRLTGRAFYASRRRWERAGADYRRPHPHHRDHMALDNLLVTDGRGGKAYDDARLQEALASAVDKALRATLGRCQPRAIFRRERAFAAAPRVWVSDKASSRTTVVESSARDRQGLFAPASHAIHAAGPQLHSAHIATYGERRGRRLHLTSASAAIARPGGEAGCAKRCSRRASPTDQRKKGPPTARPSPLFSYQPRSAPAAAAAEVAAAGGCPSPITGSVRAICRRRWRRRRRRRRWWRRSGPLRRSPFAAQGHTPGARLGEEGAEQLGGAGRAAELGDRPLRARTLDRRIEGNLHVVLVEQVLRPDFNRPHIVRPA
jgi:hypothetical protein